MTSKQALNKLKMNVSPMESEKSVISILNIAVRLDACDNVHNTRERFENAGQPIESSSMPDKFMCWFFKMNDGSENV